MEKSIYNRAKNWQIAFFTLNNCATNAYMFLMWYISYYATGVAGLGVVIVGMISTASRIWDGITDPIVGMFIDRTEGKFGKFRPFMILGNAILAIMVLVIYGTVHRVPEGFRLIYYILCYMVYIIGYTFQTACTKAGQACLTNDPEQRPQFTFYDAVFGAIEFAVLPVLASGAIYVKCGGFTAEYFMYMCAAIIAMSAVMTLLAVIGIWEHDNKEYFGIGQEGPKLGFKDYVEVFKKNRAIQMLVVSAASDKIATNVKSSSVLMVVLFGIFLGNYSLYGTVSTIVIVPGIIISLAGVAFAAKKGMKRALVNFTIYDMISSGLMCAIAVVVYMTGMDITKGALLYIFIGLYIILYCFEQISSSIVIPMIADCADYETYRSGNYIPGMMGTLFSFVDKMVSSLSTTFIALGLAAIGFKEVQPVAEDPMTSGIFLFLLAMYFGFPMIGWIANLIAMKYYPLTKEKMEEVQAAIAKLKMENQE